LQVLLSIAIRRHSPATTQWFAASLAVKIFTKSFMRITTDQLPRLRVAMQSNEWFKHCSDDFQSALLSMAQVRYLADGEVLTGSGDVASGMWCVLAGRVRLMQPAQGKPQLLRDYSPYDWMGEVTLIDDQPSGLCTEALGKTTLIEIERAVLLQWLQVHPVHWRDIARLVSVRLRYGSLMFNHATHLGLKERLLQRLYLISAAYGMGKNLTHRIRYSQQELADMLGVSRPCVSTELGKLVAQGIIELRYNEIHLLKPQEPSTNWGAPESAMALH
jgi:CRP/FNR family transcriptional regulator, cyclic AMP receptor protein